MGNHLHSSFKQVPIIRLLIPFTAGIGLAHAFPDENRIIDLFMFFGILFLTALKYLKPFPNYAKIITGMLLFTILCFIGIISYYLANKHAFLPEEKTMYSGIIYRQLSIKGKCNFIDCMLYNYVDKNKFIPIHEIVRLHIQSDPISKSLKIGDSIAFKSRIRKFREKGNPDEFNYSSYMAIEGIRFMTILSVKDVRIGGNSRKYPVKRLAASLQQKVIEAFKKNRIKNDELAVISALVVGYTDLLDRDIRLNYSASGSMHILAVSGWHIGILFLILNFLLGTRNQLPYYRYFRTVLILLTIWLYAFITGLSPSVNRSAAMFSLFILGKLLKRQPNSYNILATTAFIILLVDPNEIFMAGFQLSYMAVLGILFFQPRFARFYAPKNKIANSIWQLFSISFAAQFTTFPLCLYYFHQFPNYFWLTNIIIIPLAWSIMILTLIFFTVLPFVTVLKFVASLLSFDLKLMNSLVRFVTSLPFSIIGDVRFGSFHLILSFGFIGLICFFIYSRQKKWILPTAGLFILIILMYYLFNYLIDDKKNQIIVYNIERGIAISLVQGHEHVLLIDSVILNNYDTFERSSSNFWRNRQIDHPLRILITNNVQAGTKIRVANITLQNSGDCIILDFCGDSFCIQNDNQYSHPIIKSNTATCIDYLIVHGPGKNPNLNKMKFAGTSIIITSDVPYKVQKAWIIYALKNKLRIYILEKGGFQKTY